MDINFITIILVASAVGAAAGYLGSFMVLKRMSLVGDALSHVALPGMAIALAFNFSPILGAFIALTLAVIGVWYLEKTSTIYPETLIGVFFTASLAIGVLITPEPDLLEALFGSLEKITYAEQILAILCSLIIIWAVRRNHKGLMLSIVSEELAKASGYNISRLNLIYLLLVGGIVALGVKFIGTLLMGALVIIPAASAKNLGLGFRNYQLFSILFGIISAILGVIIADSLNIPSGPIVVLSGIGIFVTTYLVKNLR